MIEADASDIEILHGPLFTRDNISDYNEISLSDDEIAVVIKGNTAKRIDELIRAQTE